MEILSSIPEGGPTLSAHNLRCECFKSANLLWQLDHLQFSISRLSYSGATFLPIIFSLMHEPEFRLLNRLASIYLSSTKLCLCHACLFWFFCQSICIDLYCPLDHFSLSIIDCLFLMLLLPLDVTDLIFSFFPLQFVVCNLQCIFVDHNS